MIWMLNYLNILYLEKKIAKLFKKYIFKFIIFNKVLYNLKIFSSYFINKIKNLCIYLISHFNYNFYI